MIRTLLLSTCLLLGIAAGSRAQMSEIQLIQTKYRNWLTGEGVDYSRPQVLDRYNRFLNSGIAAKDLSAYDFVNPGPAWSFDNSADQNAYSALVEQKLIRLVMLYQIKGPAATPNPDYHHPQVKDKILAIFNYMKAKGISGTTDFGFQEIPATEEVITSSHGVALRSSAYATAVFLMKNDLLAAGEFYHHLAALQGVTYFMDPEYPHFHFTNPGYNSDVIRASLQQRFCYVLAQDDTSATRVANMDHLRQLINNAFRIANGWNDCIKPDFITFHHRGYYSNTYGSDALHQGAILHWMLNGTAYAMDGTATTNLKTAILAYNKFSKGFEMPRALGGRFPFNTDPINQLRPALAYLYLADTLGNKEMGREFMRLWNISSAANTALQRQNTLGINMVNSLGGMQDMVNVLNAGLTPLPERMEGQFSFPYAGLSVHKYNGYQVSVKGTSKNVWHYESSSTENIFGRYSSAGSMEILAVGNPLTHATNGYVENGWDWSRTPGVTAAYLPLSVLGTGRHREFNGKSMLAHASLDSNGVFAMDYKDYNASPAMTALKSVFFFGDKLLCMGSNIANTGGTYPVQTTLFQTSLGNTDPVTYVNGTAATGTSFTHTQKGGPLWATDAAGNGYVIPFNGTTDTITVQRAVQNSRNHANTANTTGNFTTAYINHGIAPNGTQKFIYGIVLQGGQAGTQAFANNFAATFKIWHHNSQGHAVQYLPDSIFAYAVFNPAAVFAFDVVKGVNKQAVIMTQRRNNGNTLRMSLTNPSLGLLSASENYTWSQVSSQNSILNRVPQSEVVTVTIAGKWVLETASPQVSTTINGENTEVSFTTINGLTVQTQLVKAALELPVGTDASRNTNAGAATYTVQGAELDAAATGNCGALNYRYILSGATSDTAMGSLAGVVLQKGTTTIHCTAQDGCSSAAVSFNVTVNDTEAPVVTAPAARVFCFSPEGSYTVPVLTATDNVAVGSIAYTITGATTRNGSGADASGVFNPGLSTIRWTVTDGDNNTATVETTVTVNTALMASIADVYAVQPGGAANTIYLGYGPSSLSLTAAATGGTAPYTYAWSSGGNAASHTVAPAAAGTHVYTATVSDALGCAVTATAHITVTDIRCGADKVSICHKPQTNHDNTICLSTASVADHLAHGCQLGACDGAATLAMSKTAPKQNRASFAVQVTPNPASSRFTLLVTSPQTTTVFIRVLDLSGRLLQTLQATPGQPVHFGEHFKAGIYFAEVMQGNKKQVTKLIRQ